MTQRTKLIIDTDPGIDDAMAILMAFNCEELEVLGLTTIYGNVPTTLATENALRLVEVAGASQVEVAQGSLCSLKSCIKEIRIANFVHGDDGFGDVGFPTPAKQALKGVSAAEFIVRKVNEFPGEVSILALAGLTNIAQAIMLDPTIPGKWKELVILGGAFFVNGNINPAAEANIFADPDAADFVFGAGERIRVVGLDVTHECCLTGAQLDDLGGVSPTTGNGNGKGTESSEAAGEEEAAGSTLASLVGGEEERGRNGPPAGREGMPTYVSASFPLGEEEPSLKASLRALLPLEGQGNGNGNGDGGGEGGETSVGRGRFGRFVHAISQFYLNYHRRAYNMDAIYLHDPTALVALLRPELFGWRQGAVRVSCEGIARGCTILDANLKTWHGPNAWTEHGRPQVRVALEVRREEVVDYVISLLSK